jgi:hypothetical protein
MISRREVVTAGMLGTLATGNAGEAAAQSDAQVMQQALNRVVDSLDEIKASLDAGLRGNTMSYGSLGQIKGKLETWVRTTGKFPEFWDVGISVFLEIYDWHIREKQPIQISRIAEQRMAIQWLFTQYVLRWENDPNYIGQQPYDR